MCGTLNSSLTRGSHCSSVLQILCLGVVPSLIGTLDPLDKIIIFIQTQVWAAVSLRYLCYQYSSPSTASVSSPFLSLILNLHSGHKHFVSTGSRMHWGLKKYCTPISLPEEILFQSSGPNVSRSPGVEVAGVGASSNLDVDRSFFLLADNTHHNHSSSLGIQECTLQPFRNIRYQTAQSKFIDVSLKRTLPRKKFCHQP